jgi:hypothetical protein
MGLPDIRRATGLTGFGWDPWRKFDDALSDGWAGSSARCSGATSGSSGGEADTRLTPRRRRSSESDRAASHRAWRVIGRLRGHRLRGHRRARRRQGRAQRGRAPASGRYCSYVSVGYVSVGLRRLGRPTDSAGPPTGSASPPRWRTPDPAVPRVLEHQTAAGSQGYAVPQRLRRPRTAATVAERPGRSPRPLRPLARFVPSPPGRPPGRTGFQGRGRPGADPSEPRHGCSDGPGSTVGPSPRPRYHLSAVLGGPVPKPKSALAGLPRGLTPTLAGRIHDGPGGTGRARHRRRGDADERATRSGSDRRDHPHPTGSAGGQPGGSAAGIRPGGVVGVRTRSGRRPPPSGRGGGRRRAARGSR